MDDSPPLQGRLRAAACRQCSARSHWRRATSSCIGRKNKSTVTTTTTTTTTTNKPMHKCIVESRVVSCTHARAHTHTTRPTASCAPARDSSRARRRQTSRRRKTLASWSFWPATGRARTTHARYNTSVHAHANTHTRTRKVDGGNDVVEVDVIVVVSDWRDTQTGQFRSPSNTAASQVVRWRTRRG